jgi:DNA-binding response OmpR family regulator
MPRVDGQGVLHYLERERPERPPRVIIMTADVAGADRTARYPAVSDVLPKPFDIRRLIAKVRSALDPRVPESQTA